MKTRFAYHRSTHTHMSRLKAAMFEWVPLCSFLMSLMMEGWVGGWVDEGVGWLVRG